MIKVVFVIGVDVKNMIGKILGKIVVVRLMKDGVIVDYDMIIDLLKYIMKKVVKSIGMLFRKLNVVVCIFLGLIVVECCVISDVVKNCGVKNVYLIEELVVVVIGVDLLVDELVVNVVVDIGGGMIEVVIIFFGGVVFCYFIRIGGD